MALSVRSGNRPADTQHPDMAAPQLPEPWSRTRAALLELEGRLRCSVCLSLLKQPICLGGCEHVFCRTCVDDSVGNGCPVCHAPAWVKDVQINRQLDNIIQLCSKLNSLLDTGKHDENKIDLCHDAALKPNTAEGEFKKKQIKMWFSPRRGKARYVLEKEGGTQNVPSNNNNSAVLEPYEFVSSSPVNELAKKKSTAKKSKKKKLEDINQEWGVGGQKRSLRVKKSVSKTDKTVSFCESPIAFLIDDVEPEIKECGSPTKISQDKNESSTDEHAVAGKLSKADRLLETRADELRCSAIEALPEKQDETKLDKANNVGESQADNKSLRNTRPKKVTTVSPKREQGGLKRKNQFSLSNTPKRPRKGQIKPVDSVKTEKVHVANGEDCEKPEQLETPSKCFTSPSSHDKHRGRTSQASSSNPTSPSNFSFTKKNIKGETLLHIASIKGDIEGVEELLKNGANPNVKDNAGWTPLHEACNHGHTNVVELLLQYQALVNTTGYQNDTPLHDAAKNGHAAIVRLLLSNRASPDAVNIFGLRPVDYAETEEIKLSLLQAQTNKEPLIKQPCSTPMKGQRREGAVALLASGLSASQKTDITKLAALLKAEVCLNYNSSVTHVIVGDEPMLRTMKCMMGILGGCWVLRSAWVKTCLELRGREPEEPYEVQGGPHKARLNKEQLLPRLLDGCHFYFLGSFKEHKKEDLTELVKAAGGQILLRQPKPDSDVTQTINTVAYHADANSDQRFCTQYIIYDKLSKYVPGRVRQGKVWFAPSNWLIDSITCFQLLPVQQE
ncbi:BRCA1-associated RING domain protein 1 [Gastrophryne carolinensis]